MKFESIICLLVLCSGLSAKNTKSTSEDTFAGNGNSGTFGYEILIAKMEHLEYQFSKQQLEMRKQNELIQSLHDSLKRIVENKFSVQESRINQQNSELKQTIAEVKNVDEKIVTTLNGLKLTVNQKFGESFDYFKTIKHRVFRSCTEEPTKETGQYLLKPFANENPFLGLCEQDKFGGGWLVFQYRFNGSVNFYRNWTEYRNGFGQMDGEFWLGLERLHRLTKGKNHSLLVELEAYDGDYAYALYDGFEIGSEEEKYTLKVLGAYSGTAGDSLTYHKDEKFSTHDNDNDASPDFNCAAYWKGAWWYYNCHKTHLNGQYKNKNHGSTNHWYKFKEKNGLKLTRMMIRKN